MAGIIAALQALAESELVTPAQDLKTEAAINASGIWLDRLAARFGLHRPFKNSGDSFFFGFTGNPQSTPFNQAPFRPDGETLAGKIPLGDALYRQLLKATTGGLRTNGQQDDVNQIIEEAYPGSFVVDNLDMTMTLYLNLATLPDNLALILQGDANIPKPAGVGLTVELVDAFGFDGNGIGFDQGPFA